MSAAQLPLFAGHGITLPVLLPLVAGALLVVLERAGSRALAALSLAATAASTAVALLLLQQAAHGGVQGYAIGNWPAPFGITLALDRLSALMLVLTALVACAALLHASAGAGAGAACRGPHFHALFQFQLMGLNGAFLSADLFNLFVFFEVLLAASYGLLLHGGPEGRRARLKAGLHYVSFNLAGSALFLIAASLFYGVAGTLNLADLALKLPQLAPENQRLVQAAGGLLLVVFALKAALLPLYFWLPAAYASASAPVAALFVMLSKVGVYAIVRTGTLGIVGLPPALAWLALATVLLAALGALGSTRLRVLVAWLVVVSAGLLLLAVGLGSETALAAGLFYLVHSCFAGAACFLLAAHISARRGGSDALQALRLAGPHAALGAAFFICAVAVAGLPPLAGFFAKALLLQAAGELPARAAMPATALVVAGVLSASLCMLVALARAGVCLFWQGGSTLPAQPQRATQAVFEAGGGAARAGARAGARLAWAAWAARAALAALLLALLVCAFAAGPIAGYTAATAQQLQQRARYIGAVLGAPIAEPAFELRHGPHAPDSATAPGPGGTR